MAPIFVIGHLTASSKEAQNKIATAAKAQVKITAAEEPDVFQWALTIPKDANDLSLYALEGYKDQAAFDAHMANPAVHDLLDLLKSNQDLLVAPPEIIKLLPIASFTRPTVAANPNPYIIVAKVDHQHDMAEKAFPFWKAVTESAEKEEEGTLVYATCKEPSNPDRAWMIEVYENETAFKEYHYKNPILVDAIAKTKKTVANLEVLHLEQLGGFFHR